MVRATKKYRDLIEPTCKQYAIFSQTPFFGGNELDISGMIAYTVTDKWLANQGVLGFVITQVHFQAPSSEGFRSFRLPGETPLQVSQVDDFTLIRPFPRLANKPAVFTWKRGVETSYPVPYKVWRRIESGAVPEDASLEEALRLMQATDMLAVPIPPDQRWCVLPPQHAHLVSKLQGGSSDVWIGRKGITTDLNGAYFAEVLSVNAEAGKVKIRTTPDGGRKPVPLLDMDVDAELVYPLLKGGGQIRPFAYTPIDAVAIVPNKRITSIPDEGKFREQYSTTYRYFKRINRVKDAQGKPLLEDRSTWRTRMRLQEAPFYAIYNVGDYTFSAYKVVWAEMAGTLAAAVVSSQEIPGLGKRPIVPDHKVFFVSTDNEDEAHFLCGMLNSEPVRTFVDAFTVKLQVGTLFRHLKLPGYDLANTHHVKISRLSREAHQKGASGELQTAIDHEAWTIIEKM